MGLAPGGVGAAGRTYDKDDHGAATGLKSVVSDLLNVKGTYSDGDDGRLPNAISPEMDGAFRVPSLRCVSTRPSFMHTGQMHALADVVAFFARGGDSSAFEGQARQVVIFDRLERGSRLPPLDHMGLYQPAMEQREIARVHRAKGDASFHKI